MAKLNKNFLALAVFISIFIFFGFIQNAQAFSNSGGGSWSNSLSIKILGSTAGSVTNYPFKFTLTTAQFGSPYGNIQANCADIRFTNSAGTELPYWVENCNPNGETNVWINIDHIAAAPATTDITMYYGNPLATSSSNGTTTFSFFDNFDDGDITDWTLETNIDGTQAASSLYYTTASYSLEDKWIRVNSCAGTAGGSTDQLYTYSKKNFSLDTTGSYVIEAAGRTSICDGCTMKARLFLDGVSKVDANITGSFLLYKATDTISAGTHEIKAGLSTNYSCNGTFPSYFDDLRIRKTITPEPSFLSIAKAKPSPCGSEGDVNLDGIVNSTDATLAPSVTYTPPFDQFYRTDVNLDGTADAIDAAMINDYIAGTISTFPACNSFALSSSCEPYGDVNENGSVEVGDVLWAAQAVAGIRTLSAQGAINGDVNTTPGLDVGDPLFISQYVAGVRPTLGGTPKVCDDSIACTYDECDTSTGACSYTPTCGGIVPCDRLLDNPDTSYNETDPCNLCHIFLMIQIIVDWVFELSAIVAIFFIVVGGLIYATSAGNEGRMDIGKRAITWALVGLALIILSWLIVAVALTTLGFINPLGGQWNIVNCSV